MREWILFRVWRVADAVNRWAWDRYSASFRRRILSEIRTGDARGAPGAPFSRWDEEEP